MERTWNTSPNNADADHSTALLANKSLLWGIKGLLCGNIGGLSSGLWTVDRSSDSVTANTSDNWGTSFNGAKLVRAAAGVAHSWIVLKSPVGLGPVYICIDWITSLNYTTDFIFSTNAFTGGTITDRPTATQEVVSSNSTDEFHRFSDNNATGGKQHLSLATTGEFHFLMSKDTIGFFYHHMMVTKLENVRGNDTYPVVFSTAYGSGTPPNGLFSGGVSSWSFTQGSATICGRNWDGSAILRGGVLTPYISGSGAYGSNIGIGGADFNNGQYNDFPMWVFHGSSSANQSYLKGRIPDLKFGASGRNDGDLDNAGGGNPEHVKVGCALVPWTTTTAPSL